jgi:hypothetical protein
VQVTSPADMALLPVVLIALVTFLAIVFLAWSLSLSLSLSLLLFLRSAFTL